MPDRELDDTTILPEDEFCAACGRHRSVHPYDLCGIFVPHEVPMPEGEFTRPLYDACTCARAGFPNSCDNCDKGASERLLGHIMSDETRPAADKAREMLAIGIRIQATGEATDAVVTGIIKSLLDHIDELEADLKCAIAVGRVAAASRS